MSFFIRRIKRVFLCVLKCIPKASLFTTPIFFMFLIFGSFIHEKNSVMSFSNILLSLLSIFLCIWFICFVLSIRKFSLNSFHRFDEDILGDVFTGLNKKSAAFENALDIFGSNSFNNALELFLEIKSENFNLSTREKGIVSFYTGRCYHILGFCSNALINYEEAEKNNVSPEIMPLFKARCCSETGDINGALAIYNNLLDTKYKFSSYIRTEIGQMYLKLNDGISALKWFKEAMDKHENYAEALGGAAVAHTIMHDFSNGEECYRAALLNHINDSEHFSSYYKEIQAAALQEFNTPEAISDNSD